MRTLDEKIRYLKKGLAELKAKEAKRTLAEKQHTNETWCDHFGNDDALLAEMKRQALKAIRDNVECCQWQIQRGRILQSGLWAALAVNMLNRYRALEDGSISANMVRDGLPEAAMRYDALTAHFMESENGLIH